MDIQVEKYKLVEWLISIEDEDIISEINDLRESHLRISKQGQISETEDLFIEAGLKDIEEGRTFSHDDVLREVRERYGLK